MSFCPLIVYGMCRLVSGPGNMECFELVKSDPAYIIYVHLDQSLMAI